MKLSKTNCSLGHLKQFSVDDLLTLRDRINQLLDGRVEQERRDLGARLNRLQQIGLSEIRTWNGGAAGREACEKHTEKIGWEESASEMSKLGG